MSQPIPVDQLDLEVEGEVHSRPPQSPSALIKPRMKHGISYSPMKNPI